MPKLRVWNGRRSIHAVAECSQGSEALPQGEVERWEAMILD